MADFLSRLAGRTMGLTPSVQPLVASMYARRSTPASEQSSLVPFDSNLNNSMLFHSNINTSMPLHGNVSTSVPFDDNTNNPTSLDDNTNPSVPLDNDTNASVPFDANTNAFVGTGSAQGTIPRAPVRTSVGDTSRPVLPPTGGQGQALSLRYSPGIAPTNSSFMVPDQGMGYLSSIAPTGNISDNPLTTQTDQYQEMDRDRALPQHKDGASILVEDTTLHRRNVPSWPPNGPETTLHRRGAPLWPPTGTEHMHRADRKDEGHNNAQFAQDDHILPLNESPQSNGFFRSSGEFFQAVTSAPEPLSMQDSGLSQGTRAGTSSHPYVQPYANDAYAERRSSGNVPGRASNELAEEHTALQDWAALRPRQKVPGGVVSHLAGHSDLKRGNSGEIMLQSGQDETPPTGATMPSIQVTIGRIEVRATPPPPTRSPAQRTAPSVMSLDDYVNQRMKGGH